mmetsp:Transcript_125331/g.250175  ORF Transcript_125331/g.250175 Transcript_125331/m.250175 type:complete len:122 (+) Transcript_125331:111-476(+)
MGVTAGCPCHSKSEESPLLGGPRDEVVTELDTLDLKDIGISHSDLRLAHRPSPTSSGTSSERATRLAVTPLRRRLFSESTDGMSSRDSTPSVELNCPSERFHPSLAFYIGLKTPPQNAMGQ